jgi:hypothetical protein
LAVKNIILSPPTRKERKEEHTLSRFRGMMNTPQLAAQFLGVALCDTARLAARPFIFKFNGIDWYYPFRIIELTQLFANNRTKLLEALYLFASKWEKYQYFEQ